MIRRTLHIFGQSLNCQTKSNKFNKMNDLKLYLLNTFSFVVSFTAVDEILKIALLLISVGYTAQRWYYLNKNKGKEND